MREHNQNQHNILCASRNIFKNVSFAGTLHLHKIRRATAIIDLSIS